MFSVHWRPGVAFVTTPTGRFTLRLTDAESSADLLALAQALADSGRGVGGGWVGVFVRGWVNEG